METVHKQANIFSQEVDHHHYLIVEELLILLSKIKRISKILIYII